MMKIIVLVPLLSLASGCYRISSSETKPLVNLLKVDASQDSDQDVKYVIRFDSQSQASEHIKALQNVGGHAAPLGHSDHVLVAHVPASKLANLNVATTAIAAVNSNVTINKPAETAVDAEQPATGDDNSQAFLTVRDVTGVTALQKNYPQADGRNMKVAVFDTGIDFGIEGLERQRDGSRKLIGFYDLTGFGKVVLADASGNDNERGTSYTIEGKTVFLSRDIGATKITNTGLLSETQLAKEYYVDAGVDLNENGKIDDSFPFLVGTNKDGKVAVWIDRNNDGKIGFETPDSSEQLTDYNTTGSFINLQQYNPSGAKPLAVTISEKDGKAAVQFHSLLGGHGSSCAIIIAGDGYAGGRLTGLAPKAQLLSYVLDSSGQDVYTVDEFLGMFQHAKEQQVDAISISWTYTSADLASARFIADFLDKEIAGSGIVIAMAAGNNGPGISSGLADDDIPHHGFAVGAFISKVQARNVYGWTGDVSDDVIFYSSFAPTRGGRQGPDVVSPLMSLVRGERGAHGPRFFGFGGTSSATPALIGSISALGSELKAKTGQRLNPRLLKLAIQNSAKLQSTTTPLRQGQGLIDVNAALPVYLKLFAEQKAAEADAQKKTLFAYDVRASTPLDGTNESGEGIHLHQFAPKKTITLALTADSLAQVDRLTMYEPVNLVREGDFFDTPDTVGLQGEPSTFDVTFNPDKLDKAGTYIGRVLVKRVSDGLLLTTIPVVVEIAHDAKSTGHFFTINQSLKPLEITRLPLRLNAPSIVEIKGLVTNDDGHGEKSNLSVSVINSRGNAAFATRVPLTDPNRLIDLKTPLLANGDYELVVFQSYSVGAVLKKIDLSLSVDLPKLILTANDFSAGSADFVIQSRRPVSFKKAQLVLDRRDVNVPLVLADSNPAALKKIKGHYGEANFGEDVETVETKILQSATNSSINPHLNVELVAIDKTTSKTLYRGWKEFDNASGIGPGTPAQFSAKSSNVVWLAYSNLIDWKRANVQKDLQLIVQVPLTKPFSKVSSNTQDFNVSAMGMFSVTISFDSEEAAFVKQGMSGRLELLDASGKPVEQIPVSW